MSPSALATASLTESISEEEKCRQAPAPVVGLAPSPSAAVTSLEPRYAAAL